MKHAKESGNENLEKSLQEKIKKYKKIKASVKNSGVSNKDAMDARLHPKLSTAKDVVKISHKAGIEQAKYGAAIASGISLIKNIVAVVKGEKDAKEASLSLAKDTGIATGTSYATAFAGSVIKGGMQNASSKTVQALAKTNIASTIVITTIETGKTLKKYFNGEIPGLECLEELGEKGTGQLSAAMFATAGQILIPIPVVGAMIGSVVGYALSSACYKELTTALKDAKLAHENRIKVEKECEEAIKMIVQFREEMMEVASKYFLDMEKTFSAEIENAEKAIWKDDINAFISAANAISIKMGKKTQFRNFTEFDALMKSDLALKL